MMNYNLAKNFIESLLFSAAEPLSKKDLIKMLIPHGNFDVDKILNELVEEYSNRGVILFSSDNKYYFKTSETLREFLIIQTEKTKIYLMLQ